MYESAWHLLRSEEADRSRAVQLSGRTDNSTELAMIEDVINMYHQGLKSTSSLGNDSLFSPFSSLGTDCADEKESMNSTNHI